MNMFFRLVHNDMGGICIDRLHEIRAPGNDAKHFAEVCIIHDTNEYELKFNVREWKTVTHFIYDTTSTYIIYYYSIVVFSPRCLFE